MSFIEASLDGSLNGVTPVTIVAAPAASTRRIVRNIIITNRDVGSVVLTVNYKSNGIDRRVWSGTLSSGDMWVWGIQGEILVLDAITKSIVAVLDSVPSTQPDFITTYGDAA